MTEQYYFGTAKLDRRIDHPRRKRANLASWQSQDEARKLAAIKTALRETNQLRRMIADLNRAVQIFDADIETLLERCWVRDPSRFEFPIAARTMVARRDNLRATVAALTDRLTKLDPSST